MEAWGWEIQWLFFLMVLERSSRSLRCSKIREHHAVQPKYIQLLLANYTSIKGEVEKKSAWGQRWCDCMNIALKLNELGRCEQGPLPNVQGAFISPSFGCLKSVLQVATEQNSVCFPKSTEDSLPPSFLYGHFPFATCLTLKKPHWGPCIVSETPQHPVKSLGWNHRSLVFFPPVRCSKAETAGHRVQTAQVLPAF